MTNYLVDEEIPMKILATMSTLITNKWVFLLVLNVFLLIVGCLMDIFSAIIVVVPLILPIAEQFGVNPMHLAIVFLTNLEIGYITPPVGINLFISSFRFNRPVLELYRASIPFLFLMLLALIVITYIPWFTLFWFNS
jgi:TRAP-type C4-dicarboxylate transport system permease large subunit